MRFTFAESMTDPAHYIPLAQAAEAAGYQLPPSQRASADEDQS